MKIEIMIAVLALMCIGSLAAAFVLWAKVDEQKQKTADEHANYIAALNLHNATAERAQELEVQRAALNDIACTQFERGFDLYEKNIALQDHLSALLCPRNDHVWKDGRCAKCGRAHDA